MSSSSAVKKQKDIQQEVAASDSNSAGGKPETAMQAGARRYPEPPFPKQHQPKPASRKRQKR